MLQAATLFRVFEQHQTDFCTTKCNFLIGHLLSKRLGSYLTNVKEKMILDQLKHKISCSNTMNNQFKGCHWKQVLRVFGFEK